jgi:formylglycine-generating enzyme required for sulfatase activity
MLQTEAGRCANSGRQQPQPRMRAYLASVALATLLVATADRGGAQPQHALDNRTPSHSGAVVARIAANMRRIPAGRFQMGAVSDFTFEQPVHTVHVRSFRLAAYEVTFEEFETFARATGRALPDDRGWGRGRHPVINVSWDDAQAFIRWLNQLSGRHYRLPTEAEWEYAARAGTATPYPWGDKFRPDLANGSDSKSGTVEVGSYPRDAYGLYDMTGNVWEWTQDCHHDDYRGAPGDGTAWTSGDCNRRVYRGGSWASPVLLLRVTHRLWLRASARYDFLGFRLAADL